MNTAIPEKHKHWNPADKWTIRYRYPRLMPRGIVNQLTAELHKYIDSDFEDVWAFGVVFTFDSSGAKVQVNRNKRQIEVQAYGDQRLKLMQDIVKALEDIHSTYKGLDFDIEIPCICEACNKKADKDKTYYDYYKDIMREIDDNQDDIYCRNLRQTIKIVPVLQRSGFALTYKLAELLKERGDAYLDREKAIEKSLKELKATTGETLSTSKEIKETTKKIHSKLDEHFDYLLQIDQNAKLNKDVIIEAVNAVSKVQKEVVFKELQQMIALGLELHQGDLDEKLKKLYDDLKKSDNLEMKIKTSIPLLNLLGLDIGVEGKFDIKSWSKKMYKKHELKIFQLFGYV